MSEVTGGCFKLHSTLSLNLLQNNLQPNKVVDLETKKQKKKNTNNIFMKYMDMSTSIE